MNSIFYDTDGNIIASSRALDEVTKINRQTGDIMWRLGGSSCKNNQFRFLNDSINGFIGFSHQHSVQRLQNGNLLMLDNGDLKPKPYTRAVEYKIDEINKTVEKIWEYSISLNFNSYSMGNAQRLPNGNTLIGWGLNSDNLTATEVTPAGEKVLEFSGYQNYAVYKYVYKMHAVTLSAEKPGQLDFSYDTNRTNVKIEINNLNNQGLISVEKHFYLPHNMIFSGKAPQNIMQNRWIISAHGINQFDATVKFFFSEFSTGELKLGKIYYREKEGAGNFTELYTIYDEAENCIETNINKPGEFIIALNDALTPPVAVYPEDNAVNVEINTKLTWLPVNLDDKYRLQLSQSPVFSGKIIDTSGLTDCRIDVKLNYNTIYYWRIMAYDDAAQSNWSDVMKFTTTQFTAINLTSENDDIIIIKQNNKLILKINETSCNVNFRLYDILGNQIVNFNNINISDNKFLEFNINNYYNGIFLYEIICNNKKYYGRLYIEN